MDNKALSIAYAIKRKNSKMSSGGSAESPKENLSSNIDPHELASAIIQKLCAGGEVGYAFGGEAENDDEGDDIGGSDDMFSDEVAFPVEMSDGGMVEPNDEIDPRKGKIKSLMERIRSKHQGL